MAGKCRRCDEKLQAKVRFCPYCGGSQATVDEVYPPAETYPPEEAIEAETQPGDPVQVKSEIPTEPSPTHSSRRWKIWLAVFGLGGVLIVVGTILVIVMQSVTGLGGGFSQCPVGNRDALIILIGQTNKFPELTRREIERRVWSRVRDTTQPGDLISVYHLPKVGDGSLDPAFQMCRPAAPVLSGKLFMKMGLQDLRFSNDFEIPLRRAVSDPLQASDYAPLAEALTDILLSDTVRQAARVRMMVFSDMIQNSPSATLQGCTDPVLPIERYKHNQLGAASRPTWVNTRVELHIAPRRGLTEMEILCRNRFWNWFLGDMRGKDYGRVVLDLPGTTGLIE